MRIETCYGYPFEGLPSRHQDRQGLSLEDSLSRKKDTRAGILGAGISIGKACHGRTSVVRVVTVGVRQ